MFDAEYFKDLLNETTALMSSRAEESKPDEELNLRIESNISALKHLAKEISDEELQKKTLERIDMLCLTPDNFELATTRSRERVVDVRKSDEHADRIERDILKYSRDLARRSRRLLEGLQLDEKVLEDVTGKMAFNVTSTTRNLMSLTENVLEISVVRLFVLTIVVFLAMYFIIRFV
jgi:hypothetical protein